MTRVWWSKSKARGGEEGGLVYCTHTTSRAWASLLASVWRWVDGVGVGGEVGWEYTQKTLITPGLSHSFFHGRRPGGAAPIAQATPARGPPQPLLAKGAGRGHGWAGVSGAVDVALGAFGGALCGLASKSFDGKKSARR